MGATHAVAEGGRYPGLKRVLPGWLVSLLLRLRSRQRLISNFVYDARRYAKSSPLGIVPENQTQYDALVTMNYHRVEKGLSLPQPKPFFGEVPIRELLGLIERHGERFLASGATPVALNALHEYVRWHERQGLDAPIVREVGARLQALAHHLAPGATSEQRGGTELLQAAPVALDPATREALFRHRRSVRDFAAADVDDAMIAAAVADALHTPSVCNRQAWRVRCLTTRSEIDRALRFQNGNRGFGHTINRLLVVTSTLGSFVASGERNQGWVDGGMFSMALILALHAQGLATCPLNWSAESQVDKSFRRAFAIPDDEIVLMFIAVGRFKDDYRVCQSPRVAVDRVLKIS